jgi:septal ring factor EnvC (AmiA/AmiB activator)
MRRLTAFGRLAQFAVLLVALGAAVAFALESWRVGGALLAVALAGGLVAVLELQRRAARALAAQRKDLDALKARVAQTGAQAATLAKRVTQARDGIAAIHSRIDWLTGVWAARQDPADG